MTENYSEIGLVTFGRKVGEYEYMDINLNIEDKEYYIEYYDYYGKFYSPPNGDLEGKDIEAFVQTLEDISLLNWPRREDGEYRETSDIPIVSYFIKGQEPLYYTVGDGKDIQRMVKLYRAVVALIGEDIGDSTQLDDFEKISDYNAIEYLIFSEVGKNNEKFDVAVDIEERNCMIEHSGHDGKVISETKHKSLRRTSLKKYIEKLQALDLLSWPTETSPREVMDSNHPFVEYYIGNVNFFTYGDPTHPNSMAELHRLTENLVSATFGVYSVYK